MKVIKQILLSVVFVALTVCAKGQGTFVYDQQSSDESNFGGGNASITPNQLIGQSFTPTFSSVGFIRLAISDDALDGLGATLYVNLRSGSIGGTIMASTDPVSVADHFAGTVDFLFPSAAALTPGTVYYFQPVIQSGGNFSVNGYNSFNYSGGMEFFLGQPKVSNDMWFREGIITPEPSTIWLALLGGGVFLYARKLKRY